jgi:hypothetical protein
VGRNLLLTWLAGGPASARYVAAEYTEAGRRVAARLAALEPGLDLASVPFDYKAPDLRAIGTGRQALVFTAHSVEQIACLPDAMTAEVRRLAQEVTCVHSSPWGGSSASPRRRVLRKVTPQRMTTTPISQSYRAKEGDLEVLEGIPEALGITPANATTVVVWRSL